MNISQLLSNIATKLHSINALVLLLLFNVLLIISQDAFALTKPTLTSPSNNAEITTASQTFSWTHPSGAVNPQSFTAVLPVGRVDVSGGVTVPSNVIVGKNFAVSFNLKEFQGGSKTFEYVELWIKDSSGGDLYMAKRWDNISFSANQQQAFSTTTFLDPVKGRDAGTYRAIVRGKVVGDVPFNFGVVNGSGAVNPQNFNAVLPVVPLIVKAPVQRPEPTAIESTPNAPLGKKKGLVFITHGWNSTADGWVTDVANNIRAQTQAHPDSEVDWTVRIYDWRYDSGCRFGNYEFGKVDCDQVTNLFDLINELGPWYAYTNALIHGKAVAIQLAKEEFSYIHFIAHSAGSNLIETAAAWIPIKAKTFGKKVVPKIHSTFLDAYDPRGYNSTYGQSSIWAEHYVDMSSKQAEMDAYLAQLEPSIAVGMFTDLVNDQDIFLLQAFNFDVTTLGEFKFCFAIENPLCFIERHSSPYVWYNKTITGDVSADVGFALALESGRARLPNFDNDNYRRGDVCFLPSTFKSCRGYPIRVSKPIIDFNCHDIWQCPDNLLLKTSKSNTGTVDLSVPGTVTLKSVYPTSVMNRNVRSIATATRASDSSAWVSMQINVTQPINTLLFDYSFLSQNAEGFLSVFVDNQVVYKADQRFTEDGVNSSKEVRIGDVLPGTHSLSFRLDPFTDVQSVIEISNIQTGVLTLVDNTKAKIYLSANDGFIVSNSGATVLGSTGNEVVTLGAGVSGAILDKNIERVVLADDSGYYNFKQTGDKLNVYDSAGSQLLVSVPLQGDADGTQFKFSNGVFDAKLSTGVMSLGGVTVSTTVGTLMPTNFSATTEPTPNTPSAAKVFLGAIDTFLVSSNGSRVFGNTGEEVVTLGEGVSNITLDQNIEKVILRGASSSYTYKQTGNKINIYDASGITPIAALPVQDDTDGTLITFSDGTASAKITAGVMSLGLATINSTIAAANPFPD
ncbi:MAG: hypothetical protein Q8N96_08780 [Methylovulum sp.]|nr:hypothetical protein [Methylovulum sp.]